MHYDIIIVGFGTAGATACIAAARRKHKVLVLERNTYAGGTQSGGFISGFYYQQATGLSAEIQTLIESRQSQGLLGGQSIENRKAVLEHMALEAGAELHYECTVTELLQENGKVQGLIWYENEQRSQAQAKIIIDCSGEAVLCRLAGVALNGGRGTDGRFQPFTNTYARQDAEGMAHADNFDAGYLNPYDAEELSATMLETSRLHLSDDFSRDKRPLLAPADLIGIREGLHAQCQTQLTLQSLLDDALNVCDPVDYVFSNIDTHANDLCLESEIFQDWMLGASMWGYGLWIPVSLGCLLPQGPEGLVLAGRHLGVDHDLGHAVRMNACMGRLGEAAGLLAALALEQKLAPHRVPYQQLATALSMPPSPPGDNHELFLLTNDAILTELASESPGRAIWAARTKGDSGWLKKQLKQSPLQSNLRCHLAQALALKGDSAAVPDLRRCLFTRDNFVPKTSRKNNHTRAYVAVYLLGRLRDRESLSLLIELLYDKELSQVFQYQSQAMMAMLKIAASHPQERQIVAATLLEFASDPAWRLETYSHLHHGNILRFDLIFRSVIAATLQSWQIPQPISRVLSQLPLSQHELGVARRLGVL